jgi:hypothetical protein
VEEARVSTRGGVLFGSGLASDHLTPMPLPPTREFRQHGAILSLLPRLSAHKSPWHANVGFSLEMRPHVIPTTPKLPTPSDPR